MLNNISLYIYTTFYLFIHRRSFGLFLALATMNNTIMNMGIKTKCFKYKNTTYLQKCRPKVTLLFDRWHVFWHVAGRFTEARTEENANVHGQENG